MTDKEFRLVLRRLGLSQTGFARRLRDLGDPRSETALRRSISNWYHGHRKVPAEMCVIINLIDQVTETLNRIGAEHHGLHKHPALT